MKFELNKEQDGYTLVVGDDVPTVVIPQEYEGKPVTSIGTNAFCGCTTLTNVTIEDGVTRIGTYAFSGCTSLTSITIPDSVTSIGSNAFAYCKLLTSIIVSESNVNYKSIDGNLYSKDGKTLIQYAIGKTAKEFIIPDSVTSIGQFAFSGCTSLRSVRIPDSVTDIGDWAFYSCTSLTSVHYNGDMVSWDKITFGDVWANPLYYGATLHTKLEKRERKRLMKFILNSCDISFIAEAPEDITLKQLIKQCDKIIPDWCACGICSLDYKSYNENIEPDIIIGVDSIKKANEDVSCSIKE